MARYLFAWELGGGSGHCVNLEPLIGGLVRRGHEVFIAARDLHVAQRVIGGLNVSFFQAPILRSKPANFIRRPRSFGHILHNIGFGEDNHLGPLVAAWRKLIEVVDADVVVCEHAPSALLAGRLNSVKRVVAGSGFVCPPDASPFPTFAPIENDVELTGWSGDLAGWSERLIVDRISRLLAASGQSPIERLSAIYADADDQFLLTFEELDHYRNREGASYWGMRSPTGGVLPQWPAEKGPRLFAYFQPAQYGWRPEAAAEILRRLPITAVLYVPNIPDAIRNKLRAPNIHVESQRLDIAAVCSGCSVAITHGNNGTATHLLQAGVPQLVIPIFLEQAIFAKRLVELGAAVAVQPHRPDSIYQALTMLLGNTRYATGAASFASRYSKFDAESSITQIVDRLEKIHAA
jgi:UDP:flavonoid glycosyltransferase YjiC (YdhE family)